MSRGNLPWVVATGKDRYRRGMYTFWKRTSPYPALIAFDVPTADATTVRRNRSNSPMHPHDLNEELFVEAAQGLAGRVLNEVPDNDAQRLQYAFRLCLARDPDAAEKDALATATQTFTQQFRGEPSGRERGIAGRQSGRAGAVRDLVRDLTSFVESRRNHYMGVGDAS